MNPHVKTVRALEDFVLEVRFDNGEFRRFDVKPYLDRSLFVRLRDREAFCAVQVVAGSSGRTDSTSVTTRSTSKGDQSGPQARPNKRIPRPRDRAARR